VTTPESSLTSLQKPIRRSGRRDRTHDGRSSNSWRLMTLSASEPADEHHTRPPFSPSSNRNRRRNSYARAHRRLSEIGVGRCHDARKTFHFGIGARNAFQSRFWPKPAETKILVRKPSVLSLSRPGPVSYVSLSRLTCFVRQPFQAGPNQTRISLES